MGGSASHYALTVKIGPPGWGGLVVSRWKSSFKRSTKNETCDKSRVRPNHPRCSRAAWMRGCTHHRNLFSSSGPTHDVEIWPFLLLWLLAFTAACIRPTIVQGVTRIELKHAIVVFICYRRVLRAMSHVGPTGCDYLGHMHRPNGRCRPIGLSAHTFYGEYRRLALILTLILTPNPSFSHFCTNDTPLQRCNRKQTQQMKSSPLAAVRGAYWSERTAALPTFAKWTSIVTCPTSFLPPN